MKRSSYIIFICATMSFPLRVRATHSSTIKHFSITVEPKWEDLDKNKKRRIIFEDKWILAGDITFKKKAPDFIFLQELHLKWNGKKIKHIIGSLYEKNNYGDFMPIEKYLLCDSQWKASEQKLILRFPKPRTLYAVNTLSLVLTVEKEVVDILKEGYFQLESETLPFQYQAYAQEHNLKLALGIKPQEH